MESYNEKNWFGNLGVLIKYHREQRNKATKGVDFQLVEFMTITEEHPYLEIPFGEPVISRSSYIRMEGGSALRDEDVYEFCVKKLGFQYLRDEAFDRKIEQVADQLVSAVENYRCEEIKMLRSAHEAMFAKHSNYFYYREVFAMFNFIYDSFLDGRGITEKDAQAFLQCSRIYPLSLRQLGAYIVFSHYLFEKFQHEACETLYSLLEEIKGQNFFLNHVLSYYLVLEQQKTEGQLLIQQAIDHYRALGIPYWLACFCEEKAKILDDSYREYEIEYYNKALNDFEKYDTAATQNKICSIHYSMGISFYHLGMFTTASKHFMQHLKISKCVEVPNVFYILDCYEQLDLQENIEKLFMLPVTLAQHANAEILNKYYLLRKNHAEASEMQNFIEKEVVDLIRSGIFSDNLYRIFRNEVYKITKVTKKYRNLELFYDISSHNVKII